MTDYIHTCSPGCGECDRAERIAESCVDDSKRDRFWWFNAESEIRALAAQRDTLTATNRQQALDLLAASTREIELIAEVAEQARLLGISGSREATLLADRERLQNALHNISLCSQNSMSSKAECGKIARAALEGK